MVKTRQHTSRVTPWQMIAAEPIDHAFKQCILGEIYSHPGSKGGEAERPTFLSKRPLRISLRMPMRGEALLAPRVKSCKTCSTISDSRTR